MPAKATAAFGNFLNDLSAFAARQFGLEFN